MLDLFCFCCLSAVGLFAFFSFGIECWYAFVVAATVVQAMYEEYQYSFLPVVCDNHSPVLGISV